MGNSGGKNKVRTHPSEEGPSPALMQYGDYGDIYGQDQHTDYDSGVRQKNEENCLIYSYNSSGTLTRPMEKCIGTMEIIR